MREIKFRGHNGGEWLYDSIISIQQYGNVTHCFMPNEKNKSDQDDINNWDGVCYVGEYTGCKDGNGVEIYEGDIVKVTDKMPVEKYYGKEYICKIVYDEDRFIMENYTGSGLNRIAKEKFFIHRFIEVIGNIYENPELLEVE